MYHAGRWPSLRAPSTVMVVLGTTIHEFACHQRIIGKELVDGRTKSDHDGMVE
jgi:hypothetical protein